MRFQNQFKNRSGQIFVDVGRGGVEQLGWNEYQLLYQTYEGYNHQFLELKSWSVTIGLAALVAAYTEPFTKSGRIGILIAAFSSVPFWLTETLWKLFQRAHLPRISELESCSDTGFKSCQLVKISSSWENAFQKAPWNEWILVAFDIHVALPHLVLFVFGLALAIWWPPRSDATPCQNPNDS